MEGDDVPDPIRRGRRRRGIDDEIALAQGGRHRARLHRVEADPFDHAYATTPTTATKAATAVRGEDAAGGSSRCCEVDGWARLARPPAPIQLIYGWMYWKLEVPYAPRARLVMAAEPFERARRVSVALEGDDVEHERDIRIGGKGGAAGSTDVIPSRVEDRLGLVPGHAGVVLER